MRLFNHETGGPGQVQEITVRPEDKKIPVPICSQENQAVCQEIKGQMNQVLDQIFDKDVKYGRPIQLCALGCSTSEVIGCQIGQASNLEVGKVIVSMIKNRLDQEGIDLCVQACEHLNRALVMEAQVAEKYGYDVVNVRPQPDAGGAAATAAYDYFQNPVMVERVQAQLAIDIGDTEMGQHVAWVQIPHRFTANRIGQAHVRVISSRLKYIGGPRSHY